MFSKKITGTCPSCTPFWYIGDWNISDIEPRYLDISDLDLSMPVKFTSDRTAHVLCMISY